MLCLFNPNLQAAPATTTTKCRPCVATRFDVLRGWMQCVCDTLPRTQKAMLLHVLPGLYFEACDGISRMDLDAAESSAP